MEKIKAIGLFVVILPTELVLNVLMGVVLAVTVTVAKSIATVRQQVYFLMKGLNS